MTARKRARKRKRSGTDPAGAPLRASFTSLSKGVKWLIGAVISAGAVATAIGAILALWPDPSTPPAELRVELTDVSVDEGITLEEFTIRHQRLGGSSAPSPAVTRRLSAVTVAQAPTVTSDAATTGQTSTETTETVTTDTGTTETTGTDTTGTDAPETDTVSTDADDIVVGPRLSEESQRRLGDAVDQALRDPAVAVPIELGEACIAGLHKPDCGLSSQAVYLQLVNADGSPANVNQAAVADKLVELFTEVKVTSGEPVGAVVNYKIFLTGFRGKTVEVRWGLHRPGGAPLPHNWLKNQRAQLLEGEADKDSATFDFWIPLPKGPGPFFVRLTVRDLNGVSLERVDTPRFS
jgi:hypothetical protein